MMSDEQLMLRFQQGSRDAFVEIFERYRRPVYGFFFRRLGHRPRAEDLTQDTFLAVLQAVQRYEPRAPFRAYLCGIALNLFRTECRKSNRVPAVALDENQAMMNSQVGTLAADGELDLEQMICLRSALERLEESQREVLMLREYEELSYAEMAQVLRIPVNTVRSQLFRARMTLKEILTPQTDSPRREKP